MIINDIVPAEELTGFIREIDPALYGFNLDAYLPNQFRQEVEYAFNRSDRTRADVASYRAFDVEAEIAKRPGFSRVRGQIPPMSRKIPLGEELRLQLEALRGYDAGIANQVFDDAALITEGMLARIELARGAALTSAVVPFTVDSGFSANVTVNYGTPTALPAPGIQWSTSATATPVTDLMAMAQAYRDANGGLDPFVCLTSTQVINAVLACVSVKTWFAMAGVTPELITLDQVNTLLSRYRVPPLVAYDTQVSVDGVATRVTPAKSVTMLPRPNVATFGETTFGITAEALELLSAQQFENIAAAPGLVGLVMKTFDPVGLWTKVAGLVLPVIKDAKKIGVRANVIA